MQKEEKDSLIIDNKKLTQQRIIDRFDGAAKLTLRKLSPEELDLLVVWSTNNRLGALGRSPSSSPSIINGKGTVVNAKKKSTKRNKTQWIWSRSHGGTSQTTNRETRDREQTEETNMDFLVTCLVWCSCSHNCRTRILVSFTGMVGEIKTKLQQR